MKDNTDDTLAGRLKAARLKAGFSSAAAACDQFGWALSKYRAHENGQNAYKVKDAKEYAQAYDTSAAWLLTGVIDISQPNSKSTILNVAKTPQKIESDLGDIIRIIATACVGVWREAALSQDSNSEIISGRVAPIDPRFSTDHQFDVKVQGNGFNKYVPNGCLLRCIDIAALNIEIKDGDFVVIERTRQGMTEVSAKRIKKIGNRIELINETDDPRLKDQVLSLDADNENITIIGKILWSYRNLENSITS